MLKRAYRPSIVARACLQNVRGCLLEAQGDDDAALDAHQEAHSLLCTVNTTGDDPRRAGWLQCTRHGSAWVMLRTGGAAAAEALAIADLCDERLQLLDAREQAFARSRHAIAALQRLSDDKAYDGGLVASATLELHGVADALSICLGASHPETKGARSNLAVARALSVAAANDSPRLRWRQPWQPALGAALWRSSASSAPV